MRHVMLRSCQLLVSGGDLQEHEMGVSRQLDVSGLHERPGEAFPNPVYGQSRQAGDSLIILCGTDRVVAEGTTIAGRPPRRSVRALTSAYRLLSRIVAAKRTTAFRTLTNPGDMLAPLCVGCM